MKALKDIYINFVRNILEQSAVVWDSSLTSKNRIDITKVQKAVARIKMEKLPGAFVDAVG